MRFHQRPLQERLRALASGYLAENRSFATLPVTIYLGDYPVELEQLAELIRYPLSGIFYTIKYIQQSIYGFCSPLFANQSTSKSTANP